MIKLKWGASLLCIAAAPALAQSGVTLYGRIDTSIEYTNFGPSHALRLGSGDIFATQFGLKGSEDLGGGYRAIFKLENGFNSTTGALGNNGALFGREAWVGLMGPFGTMQAGVNYTVLHTSFVTYSLPGNGAGLAWGNAANNFVGPAFLRVSNSVRYVSPRVGGVVLKAIVARGANGASSVPSTLGDTYGASLNYVAGALSMDVDYMQQNFSPASAATLNASSQTAAGNYALGAISYDFGFIKPALIYMRHRGGPDVATGVNAAYSNPHNDLFELDATVPIGRALMLLSYGHYRKVADSEGNADSFGVRLDYPLSKRTVLYTGAAMIRNGEHASFMVTGAGGGGMAVSKPGATASSLVAGILTSF